jgi:hypothetical protein
MDLSSRGGGATLPRGRVCLGCVVPRDMYPTSTGHDERPASTLVVVAKRLAATGEERHEMCRIALGIVASGVLDDFTSD